MEDEVKRFASYGSQVQDHKWPDRYEILDQLQEHMQLRLVAYPLRQFAERELNVRVDVLINWAIHKSLRSVCIIRDQARSKRSRCSSNIDMICCFGDHHRPSFFSLTKVQRSVLVIPWDLQRYTYGEIWCMQFLSSKYFARHIIDIVCLITFQSSQKAHLPYHRCISTVSFESP